MVPVPTSAVLVAAGALTGTGHLDLGLIGAGAVLGASAGDAAAFLLARRMRPWLMRGRRGAILARAQALIARRGARAVFLSRWLVTPLGPATNYVAGAAGVSLARFMAASVPGEAIWAALHLGAGHLAGRGFRGDEAAALKALAAARCCCGIWAGAGSGIVGPAPPYKGHDALPALHPAGACTWSRCGSFPHGACGRS